MGGGGGGDLSPGEYRMVRNGPRCNIGTKWGEIDKSSEIQLTQIPPKRPLKTNLDYTYTSLHTYIHSNASFYSFIHTYMLSLYRFIMITPTYEPKSAPLVLLNLSGEESLEESMNYC